MKLNNFTKCQLTAGKVSKVAEGINKHWEKMRVCHNMVKGVNDVLYRQSISHSESISLLAKRLVKGNSIKAKACEGQFHQSRDLQQ